MHTHDVHKIPLSLVRELLSYLNIFTIIHLLLILSSFVFLHRLLQLQQAITLEFLRVYVF